MPFYRSVGDVPRKRHTQFRRPDGGLYAEELMGQEGFSSDMSLLYHRHLPTAIVKAEAVEIPAVADQLVPNHPLLPRHFRTQTLPPGGDPVGSRQLLMANDDVRLHFVAADRSSELYRNATGDEVVYVQAGRARFEAVYGAPEAGEGDYVVIPMATTHRWVLDGDAPLRAMVIEARGHVRPRKRYLSQHGQFLEHAPYCERDLRGEAEPIPYNHHNVDSDEMLFYVGGDYSARKGSGIGLGSISLHPSGFTHGPQPGSVEASLGQPRTDEMAVMVDTFRPLHLGPAARQSEDPEYAWTWARGQQAREAGSNG